MSELRDAVAAAVMGGGDEGSSADLGSEEISGEPVVGEVGGETTSEAPEREYLDFSDDNRYVRIGDEDVPVSELQSGYMKGKDYTQKTQALAEKQRYAAWAESVIEAMQADPESTIQILRQSFGVQDAPSQPAEEVDPLVREVQDLRGKVLTWEQQNVRTQIEREVADLESQYGEDFDFNEAAALASNRKISLTDAQEILYGRKARSGGPAKKAQDLARKVEAKRADSVVSAGSGSRAVEPQPQQANSAKEAARMALEALGIR